MPISFYPPHEADFPFVANESRLQRLEVPTFPQEPPDNPNMPPPSPPDDDDEAPETPLDEPKPVPVKDPPRQPNTPPLVVSTGAGTMRAAAMKPLVLTARLHYACTFAASPGERTLS